MRWRMTSVFEDVLKMDPLGSSLFHGDLPEPVPGQERLRTLHSDAAAPTVE
jgi:hypothetical protein